MKLNNFHILSVITLILSSAGCGNLTSNDTATAAPATPTQEIAAPSVVPESRGATTPETGEELSPEAEDEEDSTPDVLFRYMSGVNLLNAGQWKESLPQFDLVIRVHPELARAYFYRGIAQYHEDEDEAALEDYNKAIELDKRFAEAFHARGLLHYRNEDQQAALADLNKAIYYAPDFGDAYRNRGVLYLNDNKVDPGIRDLETALLIYQRNRQGERVRDVLSLLEGPVPGNTQMTTSTETHSSFR